MSLEVSLLPDDVIVMVMQYLDVEDILNCRLVCKRLCDLALHRDVWHHRVLGDDDFHAGAVLHLAPCLHTLKVTGFNKDMAMALCTTTCAVENLGLRIPNEDFDDMAYALVVRNQESLGRLRKLKCECFSCWSIVADVLVRTVALCSNLTSLVIDGLPDVLHPVTHGPARSSLTYFKCPVNRSSNSSSFVHTILAGHAGTLEAIDLHDSYNCSDMMICDLLAAMPKLRRLVCHASFPGLEAVAACTTLREVTIEFRASRGDELQGASDFLGRASRQLHTVHLLEYSTPTPGACAKLVQALSSSGSSSVLLLIVEDFKDAQLFHRLPALCHLDVSGPPSVHELLLSITPATAPALRRLELMIDAETSQCAHDWLHRHMGEFKKTLAVNPFLHIQVWGVGECILPNCEACAQGCHQEVEWCDNSFKMGLFSHALDKCPLPEDHTDDTNWHRSGRYNDAPCPWIQI